MAAVHAAGGPWLAPIGAVVIALVCGATVAGDSGVGLTGRALMATVAMVTYALAGVAFLALQSAAQGVVATVLVVMGASAAVLHHADPTGPVIGLFLVTAFAPLRLPSLMAGLVAGGSTALFDLVLVIDQARPVLSVAVVSAGAGFFFLFGLLLRRERDERLRADGLLLELEASREAERRSAALSERASIAREMHDVLAHSLSGLVLQLDGARLLSRRLGSDPELQRIIEDTLQLAREGMHEARQAVWALRGSASFGPEEVARLVDEHRRLAGGICTFESAGQQRALSPEAGLCLYRVAQESLSNIRKHAPGARTAVLVQWTPTDVTLQVSNAHRADAPPGPPGSGLVGMRERAALAGGSLTAHDEDGQFHVELRLPISEVRQ